MAYEARRDDDDEISKEQEKMRNDANNAQAVRTLTAVGKDVPEAHVQAVARGLDVASKVTGGKSDELIGKALSGANKFAPGGKVAQGLTNKAMESGAGEAATKGLALYNKAKGQGGQPDTPNQVKKPGDVGGEQDSSLPSSDKEKNTKPVPGTSEGGSTGEEQEKEKEKLKESSSGGSSSSDDLGPKDSSKEDVKKGLFGASIVVAPVVVVLAPIFAIFLIMFVIITLLTGGIADYQDAFGISEVAGMETGGVDASSSDPEQRAFYDRVYDVVLDYQANGKTVNPLLIVSVFHALNASNANLSYSSITTEKITQVVDAMFVDNTYSESQFRENLKTNIIPIYLPNASNAKRDSIVEEVFNYIERYYTMNLLLANCINKIKFI